MGALNSLATLGLNLALSRQAQQAEGSELREERDRQIAEIRQRDLAEQRQQTSTLKRRLAEERARAGAAGVGATGGAADAILRGLTAESDALARERRAEAARRIEAIRSAYSDKRRHNLLDFASRSLTASSQLGTGRSRSLLD